MTHYHNERLEELRKQHAELTKEIDKLEAVKAWDPEGGEYYILGSGEVRYYESHNAIKLFGTERKTREQAEKARDKMRVFNRLLAYVDEFAKDDSDNYYTVGLIDSPNEYDWFGHDSRVKVIGAVYMPKQAAIELCEKLNSGEVVL